MSSVEIVKVEIVGLESVVDDDCSVANLLHGVDVVRRKENTVALFGILSHKIAHFCACEWVKPYHRLVEYPQFRIVDKTAHHAYFLAHAVRVVADGIENSVPEIEYLVKLGKAFLFGLCVHAVRARHKIEILHARQLYEHVVLVADKTESVFRFHRLFCDIIAVDDNLAACEGQYARQAFERGGFACAVVSQKTDDLSGIAHARQVVHSNSLRRRILFHQIFNLKRRCQFLIRVGIIVHDNSFLIL